MIYFFYGQDKFSLQQEIGTLKQKFVKDTGGDIEQLSVNSDFTDTQLLEELKRKLEAQSLFSRAKFVLIWDLVDSLRKFPKTSDYLLQILDHPSADTTIVFAESELPDKRLKFFKTFQKKTSAKEFAVPRGNDLAKWIKSFLDACEFQIEPAALAKLMNFLGEEQEAAYDLWQVSSELEKLMLYAGEKRVISEKDIEAVATENISDSVFAATNLVADGKIREAILSLERIFRQSASADQKSQAIQMIGSLASQLRSLILIKDFENLSPREIASTLGWKEGRVWIMQRLSKKFTAPRLKQLLADLKALDFRLKTSEEPPKLLLTLFFQKVAAR